MSPGLDPQSAETAEKLATMLTLKGSPNPFVFVTTFSGACEQYIDELWIVDVKLVRIDTDDGTLENFRFSVAQSHYASSTDRMLHAIR